MRLSPILPVLVSGVLWVGGEAAMADRVFCGVTLIDVSNPVPAEWLRKAGINRVYTSAPLSLARAEDGGTRVPDSVRDAWQQLDAAYGGTDIKVLIMSNYYCRNPQGTDAVDVSGRPVDMACLNNDAFYEWMQGTITDQATAYGEFAVFGGFVFDDGWGTRLDCCYCDVCTRLFKEECGAEPPPFEVTDGTGVVPDNDVRLRWDSFQRRAYKRYVKVQAEAVRSVSADLMMLTIPADSFFYGRLLNANLPREQLPLKHSALIQRIERLQVQRWCLYQSFPLPRLPEAEEDGLQPWAVGAHFTANSPKLVLCTEGPFIQHTARMQMMSPAEIEQMTRITLTEGADAICFWASGAHTAYYPEGYEGMATVYNDVKQIAEILAAREACPAQVGLLYSTTTEVLEQPWRTNLSERWVHLHSFEAAAWSMLRGNVWHRTIMEDELTHESLAGLTVLVLPSVRFLTVGALRLLEETARQGLQILRVGECLSVAGAREVECDITFWHRCIRSGYRQIANLNRQYAEVEERLLPGIRAAQNGSIHVASPMGVSKLYAVGADLLLMIANWDLHKPTPAAVCGTDGYAVTDLITGVKVRQNGSGEVSLDVPAAGWRVLRLSRLR